MKLPLRISEESREPIYHQIESQVKSLIVSGQLPAGTPLPSIRALSNDLACSIITTRRAYQNLEINGLIKTIQGKGTFVKEIEAQRIEDSKHSVVYNACIKAIEQAEQLGFSIDEMRATFNEAIKNHFKT